MANTFIKLPPFDYVKSRLRLEPDGKLYWKLKEGSGRLINSFNAQNAGKEAGHIKKQKDNHYRVIGIDGVVYHASRLIWLLHYGVDPGDAEIDHINRDVDDNRIDNLRLANRSDNCCNRVRLGNQDTRGVIATASGRFFAQITRNKGYHYLGRFDTHSEARQAYVVAAKVLHGVFAP